MFDSVVVPPRTLHVPSLGFEYSHGTGAPTLAYYGNPEGVESGVIISSIYPLSLMSKFRVGDFYIVLVMVWLIIMVKFGVIWVLV